ncbi:unnamed protein product [Adineta ricciae]|uniref:TIR domain-containing protein n=1 Tax=Adineta ricciae TaxID=249248 RepID=A0A814QHF0_ADIRI|nr:unnamed protein product [Adineta ricciae]
MDKHSKIEDLDTAYKILRAYRYDSQDVKGFAKVQAALEFCRFTIQKAGVNESTIDTATRLQSVLKSSRQELESIPWKPPLTSQPFFGQLKDLLLNTVKIAGHRTSSTTDVIVRCFYSIYSIVETFDIPFVFNDKFLSALKECLTCVRDNRYSPDDFRYAILAMLFDQIYTIEKFKSRYIEIYEKLYPAATPLILQCILNYYEQELKRFYDDEQGLNLRVDGDAKHRVFLNIFPEYLLMDDSEIHLPTLTKSQLDIFCQALFGWSYTLFNRLFKKQPKDFTLSVVIVRFLKLMNYCTPSIYFRPCARQNPVLVENLFRLLHLPLFIQNVTDYDVRFGLKVVDSTVPGKHLELVLAAVELLYNLSVESCVVDYLRGLSDEEKPEIIRVLLKNCKKNNMYTAKFHCETLIALMNNDVDRLEEPNEIATSYVNCISKAVKMESQSFQKVRLSDTIIHLKIFIQNEQVKTEVVAQDGLTLLTTCATETRFDMASVQYPSMELIWSLIFDLSAAQLLRANKVFVDYVVDLTKSGTDNADKHVLKRVAEGIDWQMKQKVVEEEKRKEAAKPVKLSVFGVPVDSTGKQITKEQRLAMEQAKDYKFDMMISYCHKDSTLCMQIHKHLKMETNARIWIDTEQMYGSLTERMSEAIEHSRIILVCYSNAYKESPNCQAECTYANDLKRIIIPLRMEANYRPNGWLKLIIGDRLYIDFIKYDFERAFGDLIRQLERYDKKYKETKEAPKPVNASNSNSVAQSQKKTKEVKNNPSLPVTQTGIKQANKKSSLLDETSDTIETQTKSSTNDGTSNATYENKQILDWTNEDVRNFFHDKQIDEMLQLLDRNPNGRVLCDYYQQLMKENSPYQVVKEEMKELHGIFLPYRAFVTFDRELREWISTKK